MICRECQSKTTVDHPDAPAVWVCQECDTAILAEHCPKGFDMAALRVARREAEALFQAARDRRLAAMSERGRRKAGLPVGATLADMAAAMTDLPDDAVDLLAPHLWRRFGMTFTDLHERLTLALTDAACEVPNDARLRRDAVVHCIAPLTDWWIAQGGRPVVGLPDHRFDEDEEAIYSPFVEFLMHELGRMECEDAREFCGPASVRLLVRARGKARSPSV